MDSNIYLYTEDIDTQIDDEHITLKIDYSIKTEGIVISESTVHIEVCPKELARF